MSAAVDPQHPFGTGVGVRVEIDLQLNLITIPFSFLRLLRLGLRYRYQRQKTETGKQKIGGRAATDQRFPGQPLRTFVDTPHLSRTNRLPASIQSAGERFGYRDRTNNVASNNTIDDFHSTDDVAKNGIAAIEMRLWRVRNKPLRPTRIFP